MRRCTILGGPRDGDVVDWLGYEMRAAVPHPPIAYVGVPVDAIPMDTIRVDRYVAQQDLDGRWFYVRQGAD